MMPIDKVTFHTTPIGLTTHLKAVMVMGRILRIDPGLEMNAIRMAQVQQYLRSEIWAEVYGDLDLLFQELSTIAIRAANEGGELARVTQLSAEIKNLLKLPLCPPTTKT